MQASLKPYLSPLRRPFGPPATIRSSMEANIKDLAIIETIKEAREIQKKLELGNVKPTIGQYNKIIKL